METRNNAMTVSRTQTLNRSISTKSNDNPMMLRSKSLRSSFRLKSKRKSRKSKVDMENSSNQEMQEMVPKDKVVDIRSNPFSAI